MPRKYSIRKQVEVLESLDANGGNVSQTSEATGVSRPTVTQWRDERQEIMRDWGNIQNMRVNPTDLVHLGDRADDDEKVQAYLEDKYLRVTKLGANYSKRKELMAIETELIAFELLNKIRDALKDRDLRPKDMMQMYSTAIDKIGKLMGEPDRVIAIQSLIKEQFVQTLFRAAERGLIEFSSNEAKRELAGMLDSIEGSEYKEVLQG